MTHLKSNVNRSPIWQHFIKKSGLIATCKICHRDFSYRGTVSNLGKHFRRAHGAIGNRETFSYDDDSSSATERTFDTKQYFDTTDDDDMLRCKICSKEISRESLDELMNHVSVHEEDETDAEGGTEESKATNNPRRSVVWKFFVRKPGMVATCKLCCNDYSYRSSVSNLAKHYKRKHGINIAKVSHDSDDDNESSVVNERKFSTARYFDATAKDDEMVCKLCSKEIHQDSVADLIKHIVEEHGNFDDTDTEDPDAPKSKLLVWLYFKPCVVTLEATCLICKASVSYFDSVSSLRKHLETEHPLVKFDGGNNSNRLIISADGDLYEVETGASGANHDDSQDPIEMDTVYLDDFDECIARKQIKMQPAFERKKATAPNKLKINNTLNNYEDDLITEIPKQPFKRKRREMSIKKEICDSSSDEEFIATKRKNTHLDLFGRYISSLLKELPKRLSDQLQGDIIKQVITAKVNYEAESVKVTVPVTLSNIVTGPVTVTESISDSKLPVITIDGTINTIKNC